MKKKSNGVFKARLNVHGYKQVDGKQYEEDNKAASVIKDTTFHIILILMMMAIWHVEVLDMKGAFLTQLFEDGEKIYMCVPEGFKKHFAANMVLPLLKIIYRLKQVALAFWK